MLRRDTAKLMAVLELGIQLLPESLGTSSLSPPGFLILPVDVMLINLVKTIVGY